MRQKIEEKTVQKKGKWNNWNCLTINKSEHKYPLSSAQGVFLLGDKQSQRFKAHNEPMSRLLHYEMLPLIEHIVGEPVEMTPQAQPRSSRRNLIGRGFAFGLYALFYF